ncbi:MAG: hypothetical protein JWN33_93 [Candidatus Saccharibacteria bacterium]|nr:hypothetical protein [Candidatus Saccharibacteria bacterium]
MQNSEIIRELRQVLEDMDYFSVYPASGKRIGNALSDATTDGDRIRIILRDDAVQEYLFPDWRTVRSKIFDPIDYYVTLRRNGTIPPR